MSRKAGEILSALGNAANKAYEVHQGLEDYNFKKKDRELSNILTQKRIDYFDASTKQKASDQSDKFKLALVKAIPALKKSLGDEGAKTVLTMFSKYLSPEEDSTNADQFLVGDADSLSGATKSDLSLDSLFNTPTQPTEVKTSPVKIGGSISQVPIDALKSAEATTRREKRDVAQQRNQLENKFKGLMTNNSPWQAIINTPQIGQTQQQIQSLPTEQGLFEQNLQSIIGGSGINQTLTPPELEKQRLLEIARKRGLIP